MKKITLLVAILSTYMHLYGQIPMGDPFWFTEGVLAGSDSSFKVYEDGSLRINDLDYIWPVSDLAGQLTSDGSGNLTWAASSGGVSGLTPLEILYGATGGTIEQNAAFTVDTSAVKKIIVQSLDSVNGGAELHLSTNSAESNIHMESRYLNAIYFSTFEELHPYWVIEHIVTPNRLGIYTGSGVGSIFIGAGDTLGLGGDYLYLNPTGRIGIGIDSALQDIHMVADTLRLTGLDGTGTYLGIDVNGDVTKVAAPTVTGLTATQVVYGAAGGTIEQSDELTWDLVAGGFHVGDDITPSIADPHLVLTGSGSSHIVLNATGAQEYRMANEGASGFILENVTNSKTLLHQTVTSGRLGVGKANPLQDLHFLADTIRIEGLDGTGTFLGIDVNGDVTKAAEVDGSTTNELQTISVSGTTTATIDLSDDASDASITGAGINVVSVVGDAITITGTEVDGSITNELPTEGSMIDVAGTAVSVDINELTEEVSALDKDADFIAIYDASEAANDKVTSETLLGNYMDFRMHRFEFFDEFITAPTTTSGGNSLTLTQSGTGASTTGTGANSINAPGAIRSTTGTTATGRTAVNTAVSAIALSGGEWVFELEITGIAALSALAERYQLLVGFFDTYTAANQVDGVYFLYDEGGVSTGSAASANWQQVTASNSVRTFNTTATAVGTGSTILTIVVNADGTLATFYINGVATGTTHNTNIPTGTARGTGFGYMVIKSLGTTARSLDIDYIAVECDYTTEK